MLSHDADLQVKKEQNDKLVASVSLFAVSPQVTSQHKILNLCERIHQLLDCASQTTSIPSAPLKEWLNTSKSLINAKVAEEDIVKLEKDVNQFRQQYLNQFMRLDPTELNALLGFLPEGYKEKEHIAKHMMKLNDGAQKTFWKHHRNENGRNFYTFTVSKDSNDALVEPTIPAIHHIIKEFPQNNDVKNATLLLPMLQCSSFLGDYVDISPLTNLFGFNIKKQHMVLVEVDLEKKTIDVHDSKERWATFPDTLIESAKQLNFSYMPTINYHAYSFQEDNCLCGYYTHEFCQSILSKGDTSEFGKISLDQKNYVTKYDYIRKIWPEWAKEEPCSVEPAEDNNEEFEIKL